MYDTFDGIPDTWGIFQDADSQLAQVKHQQDANELTGLNSIYRGFKTFNNDRAEFDWRIKYRENSRNYIGRHTWNILFESDNIEYGEFGKDDADVIFF